MNVFGYLYYKFSRPYKRLEGSYYYIGPIMLLSMCQAFNIISLLSLAIKFNMNNWIICAIAVVMVVINFTYFLSANKRKQYECIWIKQIGLTKWMGTIISIGYIVVSITTYFGCGFCALQDTKYTEWMWNLNWSWR